jgi:hypothetical protein
MLKAAAAVRRCARRRVAGTGVAFFRREIFAPHYLDKHRPDLVQHVRGL